MAQLILPIETSILIHYNAKYFISF